jgi:hypothetical protein
MKRLRIAGWIGFLGGCISIWQGVQHFPLAFNMVRYHEYASLSKPAADLFILLWLCVGILLINLGGLSIYFSRKLKTGDSAARVFFLCGGVLYLARTAIEIMYPVAVPAPDPIVLVSVLAVSLIYFTSFAMSLNAKTV